MYNFDPYDVCLLLQIYLMTVFVLHLYQYILNV